MSQSQPAKSNLNLYNNLKNCKEEKIKKNDESNKLSELTQKFTEFEAHIADLDNSVKALVSNEDFSQFKTDLCERLEILKSEFTKYTLQSDFSDLVDQVEKSMQELIINGAPPSKDLELALKKIGELEKKVNDNHQYLDPLTLQQPTNQLTVQNIKVQQKK